MASERDSSQPVRVSWSGRTKGVMPLVGGYDRYLDSLRQVADILRDVSLPKAEFVARAADQLGIRAQSAELRVDFLTKVGFLLEDSEGLRLPEVIETWLLDRDSTPLLVRMHLKTQFVGEMLKALDAPMTTADLRDYANQQFLMSWATNAQIDHRRGWLQSAGLMRRRSDGVLCRTDRGTAFLDCVAVEPPFGDLSVRRAATEASRRAAHVSWEDRASGVLPMPGGYGGYLDSLRWLAESLEEAPPTRAEFANRMANRFKLTGTSVETRVSFLQKVGFLRIESGSVVLPDFMKSWLRDGDSTRVIVQLHLSAQFVGEMLSVLQEPTTTVELHRLACERYSMGWQTSTQIENRRGWLQSAGLIRYDKRSRHLHRTDKGTDFLEHVSVQPPIDPQPQTEPLSSGIVEEEPQPPDPMSDHEQAQSNGGVAELVDRILASSTDSANHTQFELVVRDAFRFLGFNARHLGGSGRTDVLLEAQLGRDASFSVAIDAKTSGSGGLREGFDWLALDDHRRNHAADFLMLIGPNPSGRRLFNRAEELGVAVLSAEELADLCLRHAEQPLGLDHYRVLFESGGRTDLSAVRKRFDEANRLVALSRQLLDAIREEAEHLGPRTARDLHGRLYREAGKPVASEHQIRGLLKSLASPLIGAIQGEEATGYVLACSPTVTAERLQILGRALSDG